MRQLMDVQDHIHRAFDAARPTFHLSSWIWCKVSVDRREAQARLVVSPRLGWEAKRTDYLPRVRSLNGGWTLYLPYAVPAIFGSPHMIKNRPPMIKNDETTIRTAGGASQSR